MISNEIVKEKLIHKGAEANLIYGRWFGKEVIFKQRIPKGYRIEEIEMQRDRNLLVQDLSPPEEKGSHIQKVSL